MFTTARLTIKYIESNVKDPQLKARIIAELRRERQDARTQRGNGKEFEPQQRLQVKESFNLPARVETL